MKIKALKVTISGSYYNSRKERIDFDDLIGVVPTRDEDLAAMHIRGRYVDKWIAQAKDKDGNNLYPERIYRVCKCYIDDYEETEEEFTFFGKDIKKMVDEELQDLATYKDLRAIPLPRRKSGVDLRTMRTVAYASYSDAFLGTDLMTKKDQSGFSFKDLKPLKAVGESRKDETLKLTNDEVLGLEQKKMDISSTPRANMTLDDLRSLAKSKKIPFSENTGFDVLYKKLFTA